MTESTDAEFEAATQRGEELAAHEPRAIAARYDAASGRVVVDLANGCTFAFLARALQGLSTATDDELAQVEVLGAGYGLHWEQLDADFTVPGLLMGIFGTRIWMARTGPPRRPSDLESQGGCGSPQRRERRKAAQKACLRRSRRRAPVCHLHGSPAISTRWKRT
jgi:hypothetical protein